MSKAFRKVRNTHVDNNDTTKAVKILSGKMRVVPIGTRVRDCKG